MEQPGYAGLKAEDEGVTAVGRPPPAAPDTQAPTPANDAGADQARTDAERSLLYRIGKKLRPGFDAVLAAQSRIGNDPVLDKAVAPWTAVLEANWQAIAAEAKAVVRNLDAVPPLHDLSPDHRRIAEPDKWRSFFLWGYGYKSDENCAKAPETARILDRIPGLNSAFFSILKPGTHIPRHSGVTKALLTCHLGLQTPRTGRCEMSVADQIVAWREGECLVFDDTYPHEVWNDTDEVRIVLLVQFRRPVGQPARLLRDVFLEGVRRSPFVQDARDNFDKWNAAINGLESD